jgi:hypothetical protein
MIGSSIDSSLIHEVGHQGAALLDLVPGLEDGLRNIAARAGRDRRWWTCFANWISEIIADFWSVARVGISSTLGLMGVVSLPRAFVTRFSEEGVHPVPWIRVRSAPRSAVPVPRRAVGPLASLWGALSTRGNRARDAAAFRALDRLVPALAQFLAGFRTPRLNGLTSPSLSARAARRRACACCGASIATTIQLAQLTVALACAVIGPGELPNAITRRESLLRRLHASELSKAPPTREVCASLRTDRIRNRRLTNSTHRRTETAI